MNKNKDGAMLADAMDSTPKRDYKTVRRRIMNECDVEYYIISNWRNSLSRIPAEKKVIIEEIFGRKIFDVNK